MKPEALNRLFELEGINKNDQVEIFTVSSGKVITTIEDFEFNEKPELCFLRTANRSYPVSDIKHVRKADPAPIEEKKEPEADYGKIKLELFQIKSYVKALEIDNEAKDQKFLDAAKKNHTLLGLYSEVKEQLSKAGLELKSAIDESKTLRESFEAERKAFEEKLLAVSKEKEDLAKALTERPVIEKMQVVKETVRERYPVKVNWYITFKEDFEDNFSFILLTAIVIIAGLLAWHFWDPLSTFFQNLFHGVRA